MIHIPYELLCIIIQKNIIKSGNYIGRSDPDFEFGNQDLLMSLIRDTSNDVPYYHLGFYSELPPHHPI